MVESGASEGKAGGQGMEGFGENGDVGRVVWWVGDSSMETALVDMLVAAFSMSLMAARYPDITFPFSQTIFPPRSSLFPQDFQRSRSGGG